MKKHLIINTQNSQEQILDHLEKMIGEPKVNVLDLKLKEKYTGEIKENRFWFTWTKTMNFTHSKPIVKGLISKFNDGCEIKMTIKDSTQTGLIILLTVLLIPIFYFTWTLIKTQDKNGLMIITGFLLLLTIILLLNRWRSKNSMIKIEKEIRQIFDQIKS